MVEPSPKRPKIIQLALLTAGCTVAVFFLSFMGGAGAIMLSVNSGSDADRAYIYAIFVRGMIGSLLLFFIAYRFAVKWKPTQTMPYFLVAIVSYALNPMSWSGKALFAELTGSLPMAIVFDGLLWVGLFLTGIWSGAKKREPVKSRITNIS